MQSKKINLWNFFAPSWAQGLGDFVLAVLLLCMSKRTAVTTRFNETFFSGGLDVERVQTSKAVKSGFGLIFGERLGLAIVWVIIGLIGCFIIWVIANAMIEFGNRRVVTQEYVGKIDSRSMLNDIFLRLFAAVAPWVWLAVAFGNIFPVASRWFGQWLTTIGEQVAIAQAFAALLLTMLLVQIAWQLFRLMRNAF